MPIAMRCPKCGKNYQLLDEQAGLRVRCKQCQSVFEVTPKPERLEIVPELPGARGPRLAETEDDEPEARPVRKKHAANRTVLWVVSIIAGSILVMMLICGGFLYWGVPKLMAWFMKSGTPVVVIDQTPQQPQNPVAPPPKAKEGEVPWPKIPTLTIKDLDHAIQLLRSADNFTRLRALEYIQKHPIPADAAKKKAVLDAVEPLTNDDDPLIKIAANLVKINWGGIE